MRNARASFVVFLCLAACHAGPSEPTSSTAPAESAPQPMQPRIDSKHTTSSSATTATSSAACRRPRGAAERSGRSTGASTSRTARRSLRVADTDAEAASETYRVTKAGPFRMMVYGDPKCLKTDAKCGLSKRRWDVTVAVQ